MIIMEKQSNMGARMLSPCMEPRDSLALSESMSMPVAMPVEPAVVAEGIPWPAIPVGVPVLPAVPVPTGPATPEAPPGGCFSGVA